MGKHKASDEEEAGSSMKRSRAHAGTGAACCAQPASGCSAWCTSAELHVKGLRTRSSRTVVDVKFMHIPHMSDWLPRPQAVDSPLLSTLSNYVSPDETVLDVIFLDLPAYKTHSYNQWIRAGPRAKLYFEPKDVVAAIVTCGGLCPGLNNVIRAITETLLRSYGTKRVFGVPLGYQGFLAQRAEGGRQVPTPWKELDRETVATIHKRGGTILGTTRGHGPDENLDETIGRLVAEGVNQVRARQSKG